MSVFGIDLGTRFSKVAITRNGGIDVVINEVSKRETSTVVSFTDAERCIGETGFDRSVRNLANTVPCVKHLIGMRMDDEDLESEKRFLFCNLTKDEDNRLMFAVNNKGEAMEMYPEQILAMFIQQLKKYVDRDMTTDPKYPANVRDCVITVPSFYTAEHRRLVYQACEITGLHCLSIVNETTAAATDYGIFRGSTLPETEEEAQTVIILDTGYGHTTAAAFKFWKGNMKVIGRVYDADVSGREMDYALYQHFTKEIQTKYKIDLSENKRARVRVLQAVDKVKCMLSANVGAPLSIENLMDIDINISNFTRDDFEGIIEPIVEKYEALLHRIVAQADLKVEEIHAVEMIGGCCRIPSLKAKVQKVFDTAPSFTLNASESVARGAAITAAVFSPKFQVREFIVKETPPLPIFAGHENPGCDKPATISFLPGVNDIVPLVAGKQFYPTVLDVTVKRADAFVFHVFYDESVENAKAICKNHFRLGEWHIGAPNESGCDGVIKIRVRVLPSGIVEVESAYTHKKTTVEVQEEKEVDGKKETTTVTKDRKVRVELTCTPQSVLGLSATTVIKCRDAETAMQSSDKEILRTKEMKNQLESYILDQRPRLVEGGMLFDYVSEDDRATFAAKAAEFENWLYDEGYDSTLAEYETRHKQLAAIADPALSRHKIHDDAPYELKQYITRVNTVKASVVKMMNPQPEHISDEEFQGAIEKCLNAVEAAEKAVRALAKVPKTEDPVFNLGQFDAQLKELTIACNTVINKPKPKPKAPTAMEEEEKAAEKEEAEKAAAAAAAAATADDDSAPPPVPTEEDVPAPEKKMDLD